MAKIELAILVGAESKAWLEKAEQLVNRMEELTKGKKSGKRSSEAEEGDEESEEDEEESTSKKGAKSKKKVQKADADDESEEDDDDSDSADDEEDSDDDDAEASDADTEEDSDDDGEPVKKAKGKKPKKVTHEDAQAACKERVKREVEDNGLNAKEARTLVTGILKKKFKVSSVSDLDEDQYAEVVKAMKKA